MNYGFIKLQRSETTWELIQDPKAFHLLSVIAFRARFSDVESLGGLRFGQALIGDYDNYGMTRQEYRQALRRLERYRLIEFVTSSKGTIATLRNSRVFSLRDERNSDESGHQKGEPESQLFPEVKLENGANEVAPATANGGPTESHRAATNSEGKKGKNEKNDLMLATANGEYPKNKPERKRLFEELARMEGSDPAQLTKSAKTKIAVALAEILNASPGLEEGEITRRAESYRKLMPDMMLTAHALKVHWARFAPGAEISTRTDSSVPANLR